MDTLSKFKTAYVFVAVALFIVSCGSNQDRAAVDDYSANIDSLIQTSYPRAFNGVILISQKGDIKYAKAFGYSNVEEKTPISMQDNFRIQSNSKQITAVLILKAVESGNIELHKPISAYLPDLKPTWADTVTVHHLLNMSSGVIGLDKPLLFEPGTDYKYSNSAYSLLGIIIENVTGNRYIDEANNLFKELSMNHTFCYEFGANKSSLIHGYTKTESGYELVDFYSRGITPEGWENFIPAGGIISNVHDLHTWDTNLHNGDLLSPESYERMISYSIKGQHAAFGLDEIGYGYGVRIDDSKPLTVIGHAGKGMGFANIKFYVPEKELDVIVLENVYSEDPSIVYHFEHELRELIMNSSLTF